MWQYYPFWRYAIKFSSDVEAVFMANLPTKAKSVCHLLSKFYKVDKIV